ncbi:MAG: SLBB domain-containing protein [Pseudomonadota bacterium]
MPISDIIKKMTTLNSAYFFGAVAVFIFMLLIVPPAFCQEYVIGEGDLLRITVYDNPDLAAEARVSSEGKIMFPLIGEVGVTGLSSTEAGGKIALLLENGYIKKPQVAVFIVEYRSKKVTVLGEFIKPGLVELSGNSMLLEVISKAGGLTENAGDTLYINRKTAKAGAAKKEDATIAVDLIRLLEGKGANANVSIFDGDSIYVPKAEFVYVNGEVKTPGAYKITKGLTVLKAITIAGGFTPKASQSRVKIIRKATDKDEVSIKANMDDLVMPDDIVTVPVSFF